MNFVERKGTKPGEFKDLSMIKFINEKLYICDCGNNRFQVMNTKLEYVNSFGCHGNRGGEFDYPNDIAEDGAGHLYVSDYHNHHVQVFDCKGLFLYTFCEKGAFKRFTFPSGICVDSDQFVYICDSEDNCVTVRTIVCQCLRQVESL